MTDDPSHEPASGADRVPPTATLPPSHLLPRSRDGWIATVAYVLIFLLAMPPVTHRVLDRPDVWVAGVPLFFGALLGVYTALIGVLLWSLWKGL